MPIQCSSWLSQMRRPERGWQTKHVGARSTNTSGEPITLSNTLALLSDETRHLWDCIKTHIIFPQLQKSSGDQGHQLRRVDWADLFWRAGQETQLHHGRLGDDCEHLCHQVFACLFVNLHQRYHRWEATRCLWASGPISRGSRWTLTLYSSKASFFPE